ncbi:mitochondrial import inner membrane translocase subunit TIM44-like [Haliotis rubra]|uniref:mitochondrial import inner membrane translocase subunit TIM44-like n=1 Tax=Haliotis rubra TaxID=36100 RepID=UPI001EE502D1|nr:mitochondrial import inner membrane translocase subunit TIM44-like [Haliotis rubra]
MASMCRSVGNLCRQSYGLQVLLNHSGRPTASRCPSYLACVQQNSPLDVRLSQSSAMSGGRRSFISQFLDNIKQEIAKNKEMKDNLKKFKEETDKLEQSDAIRKARQKFENIESETAKSSQVLKKTFGDIKGKMSDTLDEVGKTEFVKKVKESSGELGKTATKAAESISKSGQQIGKSATFKSISEGVKAVKEEFDEAALSRAKHYKAPEKLRKRREGMPGVPKEEKTVEANEEATGMVLHKDSKWFQSWQNFKDNNPYVHKMFDLKVKYDESDNVMVRATRAVTDKVGYLFGGVFSKTEMSEVLTEVCKVDPSFDKEMFVRLCEKEIIPNVLEAMIRGDLDVLKDWCHEGPFNTLSHPIKQAQQAGYKFASRVLDVNNVDVVAGKIMDQGPVLVISFNAQQIMVVKDKKDKVVEGNPDKIMRILYVWALCRDQEEINPRAAWKLMDISASTSEQWL